VTETAGDTSWAFRVRPIAICVFRREDGALLLAPGYDHVKQQRFYRPLGGEIEFGELAEAAVRREIREELASEVEDLELLGVFENIFVYQGLPGHELVWAFSGRLSEVSLYGWDVLEADESGAKFAVHWLTPASITAETPVYPEGLTDLLQERG
jgi:ADP-ribose pyrophosphatase YjhB (NUDIX family)